MMRLLEFLLLRRWLRIDICMPSHDRTMPVGQAKKEPVSPFPLPRGRLGGGRVFSLLPPPQPTPLQEREPNTAAHRLLLGTAAALALSGCAVGPDYVRPEAAVPAQYKEAALPDGSLWKTAQPADMAERGAWWRVFDDAVLNGLMAQQAQGNFSIAQAEAQYRQAQALVQQSQAGLFPQINAAGGATRSATATAPGVHNQFSAGLGASWELDLWGTLRRGVEVNRDKAEASAAQLAAMRLSMQAQLASAYLQLRVTDQQISQLQKSTAALQEALTLTQNQYAAGVVAANTVASAQSQWQLQKAQLSDRQLARAQLEHAVAASIGVAPAQLTLLHDNTMPRLPVVPAGLPSTLLERRPDIAAAERNMAAANAQIGVAKAAYFPALTLSGSTGYAGSAIAGLLTAPNSVWALGASLLAPLFDGGQRSAQVAQARAAYDASVAAYRQTVITAFQGVEDNLAAQRLLAEEAASLTVAFQAAEQAEAIAMNQYRAGIVSYITVLTAQNARLTAETTLWSVKNRQYATVVALIAAIGGRWDAPAAP